LAAFALPLLMATTSWGASKEVVSYFGSPTGEGSLGGEFYYPRDVAVNSSGAGPAEPGEIYVVDEQNNRVERFTAKDDFVSAWGADVAKPEGGENYEICTVASECKAGAFVFSGNGTAAGDGVMTQPQSVAVDGDTGNVYVSERFGHRIDEYDGTGKFLRSFGFDVVDSSSPFDNTGTGYEICNVEAHPTDICKQGETGNGAGELSFSFVSGFGLAVSPPDGNPATGTLYVADPGNQRIGTYHLDGTSPGSIGSSSTFSEEQPRKVAVDSRGIVYASNSAANGEIERYDSLNANGGGVKFLAPIESNANETQKIQWEGGVHEFTLTCPNGEVTEPIEFVELSPGTNAEHMKNALEAACGAGDFQLSTYASQVIVEYVGDYTHTNIPKTVCTTIGGGTCSVVEEVDGHTGPLLSGSPQESTVGLAVDPDSDGAGPDTDTLYVLRDPFPGNTVVQQFGPNNQPGLTAPPTAVDATNGNAVGFQEVRGLGLNDATGQLYVSSARVPESIVFEKEFFASRVYVLSDTPLPAPIVTIDPVSNITGTTATFSGTIDPQGANGLTCKFQYSTDGENWTDVPAPACRKLHPNAGVQPISQGVSELSGSQLYHVRLVVTRTLGGSDLTSPETTFVTNNSAPVISHTEVVWPSITTTVATIKAKVHPEAQGTVYHFEYATQEEFEQVGFATASSFPTGITGIGHGNSNVDLSPELKELKPETTYHVRVVATNPSGTTFGPDVAFTTYAAQNFGNCPNEELRKGDVLPDCRAYEQASPTDKNGNNMYGFPWHTAASPSGDAVLYLSLNGIPGGVGAEKFPIYVSRRENGAWKTHGLFTPPSFGARAETRGWTEDLLVALNGIAKSVPGSPRPSGTIVAHVLPADENEVLVNPYVTGQQGNLQFVGASDDDSKLFFETPPVAKSRGYVPNPLTETCPSAPSPEAFCGMLTGIVGPRAAAGSVNLYEYDRDTHQLSVVGLLPTSEGGAAPPEGSTSGANRFSFTQAKNMVSNSGDTAFFEANEPKQLFMRTGLNGPTPETIRVSASQKHNGAGPGGVATNDPQPAEIQYATSDGKIAFFTSSEELTNESNTGPEGSGAGRDLYAYYAETGELSDLTVDNADENGAQVVGTVGAADDGSKVYFLANSDLDGGGPAKAGNCTAGEDGVFLNGSCAIYLWNEGEITFITQIDGAKGSRNLVLKTEEGVFSTEAFPTGFVSKDGDTMIFRSSLRLTSYDNEVPGAEVQPSEYYRYHVGDPGFTCVTCNPTGAPPVNEPYIHSSTINTEVNTSQPFRPRNLSADGNRFIFETSDKLAPTDTNGDVECKNNQSAHMSGPKCQDVYEWEANGTGTCTDPKGCFYLLSSGKEENPVFISDGSESGNDVFIFTYASLVPQDRDNLQDVYDVSVDGGLAYQHATPPPKCEGDGCRGAGSETPAVDGAGSAVFEGPGDPTPVHKCAKGQVRRHEECVTKKHHRKHKKQHHKKKHHRQAHPNRRTSR
jgi:hypothetical protein